MQSVLEALADPVRLRLLTLLGDGELCVCYLIAALELPQASISKQLSMLRAEGLVSSRREGKWMHYRAERWPAPWAGWLASTLELFAREPSHKADRKKLERLCRDPGAFPILSGAPVPKLAEACCIR